MAFSAQRQFLVSVAGISGGFFAQTSGGDVSTPTSKAFDGGDSRPQILTGNPVVADLDLTRPYDPLRDGPVIASLNRQIASGRPFRTTVTQDPTDPAYSPVAGAPPLVWTGVVTKVTPPKVDGMQGNAQTASWSCTLTCDSLT